MTSNRSADPSEDAPGVVTERQVERAREDSEFTPVVVKRTDQSIRHPDDVLQDAIREGAEQTRRTSVSLFLSAVSAGAILSFAAMAVGLAALGTETGSGDVGSFFSRLPVAFVYPLGFVLCLMSGTQLFTEHTALAVYPVLDRRASVASMLRVWTIVLAGNMVGCLLGASLLAAAEEVVHAAPGYDATAKHLLSFSALGTLMSALLAGWLMALGGWLVMATPPDFSQIAVIYLTTFLIGLGGLHHSIAGTSELMAAAFTGAPLNASTAFATIGLTVFGNLVGGSLFVAILNYGQIRQTQRVAEDRS